MATSISMTGFGRSELETEFGIRLEVEIKSVNHRFLDTHFKLPNVYNRFESLLAKELKKKIKRGRVEVFVLRKELNSLNINPRCNVDLLKEYLDVVKNSLSSLGIKDDEILREVLLKALNRSEFIEFDVKGDIDLDREYKVLKEVFLKALEDLVSMRKFEGKVLGEELLEYLKKLKTIKEKIKNLSLDTSLVYKERLALRLKKLESDILIDPERLAMEVALIADKTDYSEEVSRLGSHFIQFEEILSFQSGRKLDFLVQEMMREINTIGSKAQDSRVSSFVIEAKTIIEKIREQVQNIE